VKKKQQKDDITQAYLDSEKALESANKQVSVAEEAGLGSGFVNKEQFPPLKVEPKEKEKEETSEALKQQERVLNKLEADIDESIKEEVKHICLQDKFTIDGYELEWNKVSKNTLKNIGDLINLKNLPENLKDATDTEKGDWLQIQYMKLMFKGFTEEMYWNMSIQSLKILDQAPGARMRGLFPRRG
jgi:hypothetical protein